MLPITITATDIHNLVIHECGHLRKQHAVLKSFFSRGSAIISLVLSYGFFQHCVLPLLIGDGFRIAIAGIFLSRFSRCPELRADRYIARYGDVSAQLDDWFSRRNTYQPEFSNTHPSFEGRARALAHATGVTVPAWAHADSKS
jgi:Zn-dependent protease with chaperone function